MARRCRSRDAADLDRTYDFIVANPSLYQAGDFFTMCTEPNNGDRSKGSCSFYIPAAPGGTIDITKHDQFLRDLVTYANAAFAAVNVTGDHTWADSNSLSLIGQVGFTLVSGEQGRGIAAPGLPRLLQWHHHDRSLHG